MEIEAWIESQRHDGGRACAGPWPVSTAILSIAVHEFGVVGGRRRIYMVKMVALHPVLQLAGLVASVCAHLKHGDHDNFHRNGFGLGGRHRWNGIKRAAMKEVTRIIMDCDGNGGV